jgi:DNA-binding NarL/FixJ family response regulator
MPTRVLIADDHQLFREGIRGLLPPSEFSIVAEAADGREAVRLAQNHTPDVAIVDVSMPGLNGVDATREMLRVSPGSKVLILTMHREHPYVLEGLRAGARGYVLKTQPAAQFLSALREVARGGVSVPQEYWGAIVESKQAGNISVPDPLSAREREVLQLVAEGLTTKAIGAALHISFKTAESHRTRIMAKLDIHDTASLVRYAIRQRMIEA